MLFWNRISLEHSLCKCIILLYWCFFHHKYVGTNRIAVKRMQHFAWNEMFLQFFFRSLLWFFTQFHCCLHIIVIVIFNIKQPKLNRQTYGRGWTIQKNSFHFLVCIILLVVEKVVLAIVVNLAQFSDKHIYDGYTSIDRTLFCRPGTQTKSGTNRKKDEFFLPRSFSIRTWNYVNQLAVQFAFVHHATFFALQ